MVAQPESGVCRVVCFSPRHDLTLARMTPPEILSVINTWADEFTQLGSRKDINYVQIFENRGAIMGCSNPHPHGQIWANATVPNEPAKEQRSLSHYRESHGSCLLCAYARLEQQASERLVCENDSFVVIVPFWAVWPFEVLLLSKRHVEDIAALDPPERTALADILKRITTRYDNLFQVSFPYSMGFHQRPTDGTAHEECHLHAHFYPPLLRSATVKKFMVGYEMLAMPQRDITPEAAAARLREVPEVHFLEK
jgi:UDPglucose--hexose-1-phosphate uridylyltransferase